MAEGISPIQYTSRDYAALKADLIAAIPGLLPEWTSRSSNDFGIVMIDLFAYCGDILNYYSDRIANEAFLATATQRASVLSIASMLDYKPLSQAPATVSLQFTISATAPQVVIIPAGTQVSTRSSPEAVGVPFETLLPLVLTPGATGLVDAVQGETTTLEAVGTSTGSVDQQFLLYRLPVIESTLVVFVDEGAGPVQWSYYEHLIDAFAGATAFSASVDEDGAVTLEFGDDANGKIPGLGATITASYRTGGGLLGNVGSGTVTEIVGTIPGVASVTNPGNAAGGADAETTDNIRKSAPKNLRALDRAVTLSDYKTLAQKVAGVQYANATATVYTNVLIYLAPVGGGIAPATLKNLVINYLADKKMINTSITILDPTYTPVNITAVVDVLDNYSREAVRQTVANRIASLLDLTRVDFAFRVALSDVYEVIAKVEGVDYGTINVLSKTAVGLADVQTGQFEIPVAGTITVTATGGLIGS